MVAEIITLALYVVLNPLPDGRTNNKEWPKCTLSTSEQGNFGDLYKMVSLEPDVFAYGTNECIIPCLSSNVVLRLANPRYDETVGLGISLPLTGTS